VDERVLVEVSGLGAERVTRAVREALAERILAPAGEGVAWGCRFRHDLMRAFVADSMAPSERAGLHARFARAMAGHPAYGSPAEMAYHWDAAGDDARAFDAHVAAGLDAVEAFAFDEAFRHLERALELWARVPDIDDRTALDWPHLAQLAADAAAQAGHLGRAIELARAILERPDVGDPALLAYVRSSLRWHLWRAGRMDEALAEADAAAGSLAEVGDRRWYANALAHHAGLLMLAGQRALARRRAAAAKHVAESVGASEEAALAEGILGWCLVLDGRIDEGIGRIRAVRDATRASRPLHLTGLALAESQHVAALEACGRLEEAVENAMAARAWADTHGLARTFGSVLAAAQARCLYQLGRWTEMSAVLAEASVRGAVSQGRAELAAARALLTAARGEAMDLDGEAVSRVEEAAALPSSGWLDAARAESALWDGDAEKALGLLAGAGGAVPADGRRAPASLASPADASLGRRLLLLAWAAADVALRHRAVRRTVDADRLLEDVRRRVAAAVRRGRLAATGSADLAVARAELVRAASDEHRRVAAWRRAIEASAGQRPYLEAHARWRLAEALVSTSGRRGEAASECLRASGIAGELGARRLAREIELLTRRARLVLTPAAAGEPGAEAAPFGLTAREREVLGLLADGLSNPEIGARLYISPRTASVHVSNILGKLGVDSRVEAATLAHRLGLAGPPLDRDGLDRQGAERAPSAR
jgi:DNA-binding NarL/FixJ family response regulator